MNKFFTLIELIISVIVISLLATIVIPNVSSFGKEAKNTAILADAKNIQLAADLYLNKKESSPTEKQPTLGFPSKLDFNKLDGSFLKKGPKNKGVHWYVNSQNIVYGSFSELPSDVEYKNDTLTFKEVKGANSYNIYTSAENGSNSKLIKSVDSSGQEIAFNFSDLFFEKAYADSSENTISVSNLPSLTGAIYLISAVDKEGLETASITIGFKVGGDTDKEETDTDESPYEQEPATLFAKIPDRQLLNKLNEKLGKADLNGQILISEMESFITTLELRNSNITDITGLELLLKVKGLNLENNNISDLTPLSNLTQLEELTLNKNNIADLTPIATLRNLKTLYVEENGLIDLKPIENLTNLKILGIKDNQISDISSVEKLTKLVTLSAHKNKISDISPIAKLYDLQTLNIKENKISNISSLSKLTSLKQVTLSSNTISDLTPLTNLVNIEVLYLNNNNISTVTPLAGLKLLWVLEINTNSISSWTPLKAKFKELDMFDGNNNNAKAPSLSYFK